MEKLLKIHKLKSVDFFYDPDASFLDIWNLGNNFAIQLKIYQIRAFAYKI